MKITTYKIPVKLTRSSSGVETELLEDQRVFLKEEAIELNSNLIPSKAKECMDHNQKQLDVVKSTLLLKQREDICMVEFIYLE